jgi:hypothetical protein
VYVRYPVARRPDTVSTQMRGPPVVLGGASGPASGYTCVLRFTSTVLRRPWLDESAAIAGLQTGQSTSGAITDVTPGPRQGQSSAAIGSNQTTVLAAPTIATTASSQIVLGTGTLTDEATVSGLASPVLGTVEFRLYRPVDATCATAIFTSPSRPIAMGGTVGTATSEAFTPTRTGTYRWRAFFSGDDNNAPVSGACDAAHESVVVGPAQPLPPPTCGGKVATIVNPGGARVITGTNRQT